MMMFQGYLIRIGGIFAIAMVPMLATAEDAYEKKLRLDNEAAMKIVAEYKTVRDKLPYLLKHSESKNPGVQLWVAYKLGGFDGPRVIRALEHLATKRRAASHLSGATPAAYAESSLAKIRTTKAFDQLPQATARQRRLIVERQIFGPNRSGGARTLVRKHLLREASENPKAYLPLLIEYFPGAKGVGDLASKHPTMVLPALSRAFDHLDRLILEGAIGLVAKLESWSLLDRVASLLHCTGTGGVSSDAERTLVTAGDAGIPHLNRVLYSKHLVAQRRAAHSLARIHTPASREVLRRFLEQYKHSEFEPDIDFVQYLETTVKQPEATKP